MPSAIVLYGDLNDYEISNVFEPGLKKGSYELNDQTKIGDLFLISIRNLEGEKVEPIEKVLDGIHADAETLEKELKGKYMPGTPVPMYAGRFGKKSSVTMGHWGYEILGSYPKRERAENIYEGFAIKLITELTNEKIEEVKENLSDLGEKLSQIS